jgi:uncharacterized protein DUF11
MQRTARTSRLLRSVALLVFTWVSCHAAAATTLWYEVVPLAGAPVSRTYTSDSANFQFPLLAPAGIELLIDYPASDYVDLFMRPPAGHTLAAGAFEPAPLFFGNDGLERAGLRFRTPDGLCNEGRFVLLEYVVDSNFNVVSFAADFETRCINGPTFYGEIRHNSSVPLTAAKPAGAMIPDAFAFEPHRQVLPGATVVSNATTIYGIRAAAPVSILGGEYSVNGGPYTSAGGTVNNRDRVTVRTIASSTAGATKTATLTVGGVAATLEASTYFPGEAFTAVTLESAAPARFFDLARVDARAPEWLITATHTEGRQVNVHLTDSLHNYEIRFSAPFDGVLSTGPYEEAFSTTGGASPDFDITGSTSCVTGTVSRFVIHELRIQEPGIVNAFAASFERGCTDGEPIFGEIRYNSAMPLATMVGGPLTTPYPYALNVQSPVRAGALVRSNTITIEGVNVPVPISILGGEYSVNGAAFTSAPGVVNLRDEVVVQLLASRIPGALRTATLITGGRSATFAAATYAPGMTLSGLFFQSTAGEPVGRGLTRLYLSPRNRLQRLGTFFTNDMDWQLDGMRGDLWRTYFGAGANAVLVPGTYENARIGRLNDTPSLQFAGNGLACNSVGRFVVREAVYLAGNLQRFAADFEHRCDLPSNPPLFGEVRFNSAVPFSALTGNECTAAEPACVADVSVAQIYEASGIAGEDGDIRLVVTNLGPATAHNVRMTFEADAALTLLTVPQGCATSGGAIVCTADVMDAGSRAEFVVRVRQTAAGTVTNTVRVASEGIDTVAANDTQVLTLAIQPAAATLRNISTRGRVLTGTDVMIGGFVIGGSSSKTVVVTAIGPSLVAAGIPNALADPALTLVRSSDGAVIASNDDWGTAVNAAQLQQSGFAPASARESAVMMTLPPGAYTAIVSGVGNTTGVAIVAVYEVDHPEAPLVNISTRGRVLTGNDVMIGGFIIQGGTPRTVVVTGIGPALLGAGIPNALANPTLTLVAADGTIVATNDDWGAAPNASQIQQAGFAPANPRESAIMVTLPPGAYTAVLSGAGGTTGVGIIAVYSVP